VGDSRDAMPGVDEAPCDVVITSPPYGDNITTVPYGQYSFLPLQWIDFNDIHPAAKKECLNTTHEIDHRSLGGIRRIDAGVVADLHQRSPTLKMTMDALATQPRDHAQRVAAFVRDLDGCLSYVLDMLRSHGIMVWVLGNRRVGGRPIPLDSILAELLIARGSTMVTQVRRRIPSKRMAVRNNVAETMANEQE
jgi:hypothetical protein